MRMVARNPARTTQKNGSRAINKYDGSKVFVTVSRYSDVGACVSSASAPVEKLTRIAR